MRHISANLRVPCQCPDSKYSVSQTSHPMDIIQHGLSLVPIPCLSHAFSAFRFLWTSIQQVRTTRMQLLVLASCISQFLCALDTECRANKQTMAIVAKSLQELCRYINLNFCIIVNSVCLDGNCPTAYLNRSTSSSENNYPVTFSRQCSRRMSGSHRSQFTDNKLRLL